jgi:hypothetical protein
MNKEEISLLDFLEIVDSLARLHEWEAKNFPLVNSMTGRALYYRIAQRELSDDKPSSNTMKALISDSGFSEKSLRNRINTMAEENFISFSQNEIDARSKFPIPKEKFFAAMFLHASQAKRILEKNFILIKKG